MPSLRLLVEVDAIGFERIALLLRLASPPLAASASLLVDAAHRPRFRQARPLGDAVADVVDRVVAGHVLLLQEIGGVALALGEDRDQHVGAGHLLAAGRLHMDHGALDHALEAGGGLGILAAVGDQVVQFGFEIARRDCACSFSSVDVARAHHRGRVLVVDQREQQVLERRVFVVTLVGERQRPVERLLEAAGESWHYRPVFICIGRPPQGFRLVPTAFAILGSRTHFFSMTHCKGCWCLRAKSMTCVTLVSATS